jgi:hypothetical protein
MTDHKLRTVTLHFHNTVAALALGHLAQSHTVSALKGTSMVLHLQEAEIPRAGHRPLGMCSSLTFPLQDH